jgi:hypothetical protein
MARFAVAGQPGPVGRCQFGHRPTGGPCNDAPMKRSWLARVWGILSRVVSRSWRTRWVRLVLAIAGVLGVLAVVVVFAPPWFVDNDSLAGLKAQNEVRTTLLQGVAGSLLAIGAYFTYRQLHTTREGQITERYTRAIDQLGHSELDVRIGGIYALERIARDSSSDRQTIGEVLSAFIRSHAPWPPSRPRQYVATAPIEEVPDLNERAPDVQAGLTVLGRGGFAPPTRDDGLYLALADLRRAYLIEFNLEAANLYGVNLERAFVVGARLDGVNLNKAHCHGTLFIGASLDGAYLQEATLEESSLQRASLEEASLEGANLGNASLEGANLKGANLKGANVRGAILKGANLERANLDKAQANARTTWPNGFDWRAAGVSLRQRRAKRAQNGADA